MITLAVGISLALMAKYHVHVENIGPLWFFAIVADVVITLALIFTLCG